MDPAVLAVLQFMEKSLLDLNVNLQASLEGRKSSYMAVAKKGPKPQVQQQWRPIETSDRSKFRDKAQRRGNQICYRAAP
jgi:hypothetical protein